MKMLTRLKALEKQIVAKNRRDGSGNCICFPEGPCGALASRKDLVAACAVECPEHGDRLSGTTFGSLYMPRWLREPTWYACWPHACAQTRKAMLASYPNWPLQPERYVDPENYRAQGDDTKELV